MKKFVFGLELGIKSKVARVAGRSKCLAHFRSKGWLLSRLLGPESRSRKSDVNGSPGLSHELSEV